MIYTTRQAISVCWSLKVFSRRCDLWIKITAGCTDRKKYTAFGNTIILRRQLIIQRQKLVIAHTKPQVRIVSSYFTCNCNLKRTTTMNVNGSQKRGPTLHYITQAHSRTTWKTVMHHTVTHFNSKSANNRFLPILSLWKVDWKGNFSQLVYFSSPIYTDFPPRSNPRHLALASLIP